MVATTLRTFLLETPPNVTSVEVLGSWDNFTQPYPLDKDRGLGRGHWRGCHAFPNVREKIRTVGLNMGGIYWYFYRFDGDLESYDPVEPSTTMCPLMPGQNVNVLEVPLEDDKGRNSSTTSLNAYQWTLDPNEKYATPKPYDAKKQAKRASDASAMASFHDAWKKRTSKDLLPRSRASSPKAPSSGGRQSSSRGFIQGVKKRAASLRPSSLSIGLSKVDDPKPDPSPEQKETLFSKSKRLLMSAKGLGTANKESSIFYKHSSNSVPDHKLPDPGWNVPIPPLPSNVNLRVNKVRAPVNTRQGDIAKAVRVGNEVPPSPLSLPDTSECPLLSSTEPAVVEESAQRQPLAISDGHDLTLDEILSSNDDYDRLEERDASPSKYSLSAKSIVAQPHFHQRPPPLDLSKRSSFSPDIAPSFTYTSTLSPCRLSSQLSQPPTPPSFRPSQDNDFSWARPDSPTLSPLVETGPVNDASPFDSADKHHCHAVTTNLPTPLTETPNHAHYQSKQVSAVTLGPLPGSSSPFEFTHQDPSSPASRHEFIHAWNQGQKQYLTQQQQLIEEMGYLSTAIV